MKIENGKLKQKLEKTINKLNNQANVLQKLSEDIKMKEEANKKQTTYISKLENQLLKGTLSIELIEGNKKLEERIANSERELREISALNNALKVKLSHQEDRISLLNNCLVKFPLILLLSNFSLANQFG